MSYSLGFFYLLQQLQQLQQLFLRAWVLFELANKLASFARLILVHGLVLLIVIGLSDILAIPQFVLWEQFPFWFKNMFINLQITFVSTAVTYAKIVYKIAYTKKLASKAAKVTIK